MIKGKKIKIAIISFTFIAVAFVSVIFTLNSVKPKTPDPTTTTAKACPNGFITVPGNEKYNTKDFCVMKYEASDLNGIASSQPNQKPWVDISQTMSETLSKASCDGCHLITENEWMTIAQNVLSVPSNWILGSVGGEYIYSGHSNDQPAKMLSSGSDDSDGYYGIGDETTTSQRRTLTLTNGQVIWDFAGNASEWTSGQTTGGQPGFADETAYSWKEWNTITINGNLQTIPIPGYGNEEASIWSSRQGVGRLYSNAHDDKLTGFIRGGDYNSGESSGVMALDLSHAPDYRSAMTGFRAVK